jgi:hypothetical protein
MIEYEDQLQVSIQLEHMSHDARNENEWNCSWNFWLTCLDTGGCFVSFHRFFFRNLDWEQERDWKGFQLVLNWILAGGQSITHDRDSFDNIGSGGKINFPSSALAALALGKKIKWIIEAKGHAKNSSKRFLLMEINHRSELSSTWTDEERVSPTMEPEILSDPSSRYLVRFKLLTCWKWRHAEWARWMKIVWWVKGKQNTRDEKLLVIGYSNCNFSF